MTPSSETELADHLGRMCGMCALGVLLVIVVFAIPERPESADQVAGPVLVLGLLAAYAGIGLLSRTASLAEYQLADRRVPTGFAGLAAGAEWVSAALVLGTMGSLYAAGYEGHALMIGLTGGYVLSAVLIGPFLRNTGAVTPADFLAARFGGNFIRFLAVVVLAVCAFTLAVPLIQVAGTIVARTLHIPLDLAAYCVLATILIATFPGGMRALAATQVAQWAVLIICCVALFLIYETQKFDAPAAPTHDPVMHALEALLRAVGLAPTLSPRSVSFRMFEEVTNLELILCLMSGTAVLPHILMRPLTTAGMREARASFAWSVLAIAVLIFALPTFVALSGDETGLERRGIVFGLLAAVSLTAMLATTAALLLAVANSLGHDVWHKMLARGASARGQLWAARLMLIAATALAGYLARATAEEPVAMVTWAFSLAAAGFFPALILGIWWTRTTSAGAVCGIIAGFGLCLFYIVVTRYFPQAGVDQFGMTSLINPTSGRPLVNVAQVLADARWLADVPASAANPLASKVGWFDVSNLACGILAVPAGFLTIIAVSFLARQPSAKTAALIDDIRAPTGTPILKP